LVIILINLKNKRLNSIIFFFFFLGSVLVFLPGFEDMSMVNKVIIEELITKDNLKITIYMLHSMMQVIFTGNICIINI